MRLGPAGVDPSSGRTFDLQIENVTRYRNAEASNRLGEGDNQRGVVVLGVQEGSNVTVRIGFVDSLTNAPVHLPAVNLGVFDLSRPAVGDP